VLVVPWHASFSSRESTVVIVVVYRRQQQQQQVVVARALQCSIEKIMLDKRTVEDRFKKNIYFGTTCSCLDTAHDSCHFDDDDDNDDNDYYFYSSYY
jgi:hypothetical protein